jgi:hypothetical protein
VSDKKAIVLDSSAQLQQIQAQDQLDPNTLPYNLENNNSRLIRLLIRDLVGMNFPLSQELINELYKPT